MATILLVCTGNICRSPMAQGLLRDQLARRGIDQVHVESCGTAGWDGSPATPEAVAALGEQGIDISSHLARRLVRRLVDGTSLVLGMTTEHRDAVLRMAPDALDRTFTLKEFAYHLRESEAAPEGSPEKRLSAAVE